MESLQTRICVCLFLIKWNVMDGIQRINELLRAQFLFLIRLNQKKSLFLARGSL